MRTATIHVPQPCAERWDAMTPTATGRHCASCQKTVIDFTQKTDAEVLRYFQKVKQGSVCGRYQSQQLGRPLLLTEPRNNRRWTWLTAAATLWSLREGVSLSANSQTRTEQQPVTKARTPAVEPNILRPAIVIVRGVVRDSATRQGLPGVTVLLRGTAVGVSTNSTGEFELELPATQSANEATTLRFSLEGYHAQEAPLPSVVASLASMEMLMSPDRSYVPVITGGGCLYRKPYPWHPRSFFHRLALLFRRG